MTDQLAITHDDLQRAVAAVQLSPAQGTAIWEQLRLAPAAPPEARAAASSDSRPRLAFENVLYYVGGLIVIGAMTLFMSLGFSSFGSGGLFLISIAYIVSFVSGANYLYFRRELHVPGGLLATAAVTVVPLAVVSFLHVSGIAAGNDFWDRSLSAEALTIVAAIVAMWRFPFAFLAVPLALAFWMLVDDLLGRVFPSDTWSREPHVALAVGAVLITVAFLLDRRTRIDYAYWLYLVAMSALAIGVTDAVDPWNSDVGTGALWVVLMLVTMSTGVLLQRRVFLVFGGLGLFAYIGNLAWEIFAGSLVLPFVLTGVGRAVIATGIWFQRNRDRLETFAMAHLPEVITSNLPTQR
ncbi:MAG: hypothetical protein H7123_02040 [Thermoleophilia bacterium]|nr:hypothetical protein [Thermoleophilia bacterium]